MRKPYHRQAFACIALALSTIPDVARAAGDPVVISDPSNFVNLLRLPNGDIQRVTASGAVIRAQTSSDFGVTWSSSVDLTTVASGSNPTPLIDSTGEYHFIQFVLVDTNGTATGPNTPLEDRFLELWHTRSSNTRTTFSPQQPIFGGYNTSMMRIIQLNNGPNAGRIMLGFGSRFTNTSTDPNGLHKIRVIYSDDRGATWTTSPSVLSSIVPTGWNGSSDGAAEPTMFQKNDGTIQMYARSQIGFLTQSTSTDGGATWSPLTASNFYTSTGPPNSIRLDDGRLMMFWNNATMPPRYNGAIVYAGRDALHAAISSDDGRTWSGFREIYLDPERNGGVTTTGDTGTAYPFPVAMANGKALVITGQAGARAQLTVDPAWLLEKDQHEDFSGSEPLFDWSVFKPYGPVVSVKREREQGAAVVFDTSANKNVLAVRRPNTNDPDGASWNFPMSKKGDTKLRLKLEPGFQGGTIAIGDHFYEPTDTQGETGAIFKLDISSAGVLSSGGSLTPGQWNDLTLAWDLAAHRANVLLNGNVIGTLDQKNLARPGASYLRLRSTATTVDLAGMKISNVDQIGLSTGAVDESLVLNATDSSDRLTSTANWTRLRFDNYTPNPGNVSGTILSNVGTYTGFVSPTHGAQAIGLLVSSSTGTVEFSDLTSSQITSDILGPKNNETLTFTFVDKTNIARKAAVAGFAFRFGSTIANNCDVTLLDINGNVLPDYALDYLAGLTTGGTQGATAQRDLEAASLIHQIVFRGIGTDTWLLGSFASDPGLYDLAFTGLTVTQSFASSDWKTNAAGTWSAAANWSLSRPNATDAIATFGPAITSARTVTVDAPQTVGTLNFNNANAYTIAGTPTITLSATGDAAINVQAGSHAINAPLALASNAVITVGPAASTLTLSQLQPSSAALTKAGSGTLAVNAMNTASLAINAGEVRIASNGTASGVSHVAGLSIAAGASLDLANNGLIVDYSTASPLGTLLAAIQDGRLRSSMTTGDTTLGYANASALSLHSFMGVNFAGDAVLVRLTFSGDATLDGAVNFDDLLALAQHYGSASSTWSDGDFNRDGAANFDDLLALAQNYGRSMLLADMPADGRAFGTDWALARSLVPEPATTAIVGAGLALAVQRRREPG